jgi:hypothetical protein
VASGFLIVGPVTATASADSGASSKHSTHRGSEARTHRDRADRGSAVRNSATQRRTAAASRGRHARDDDRDTRSARDTDTDTDTAPAAVRRTAATAAAPAPAPTVAAARPQVTLTLAESRDARLADRRAERRERWARLAALWCQNSNDDCGGWSGPQSPAPGTPGQPAKPDAPGTPSAPSTPGTPTAPSSPSAPTPAAVSAAVGDGPHLVSARLGGFARPSALPVVPRFEAALELAAQRVIDAVGAGVDGAITTPVVSASADFVTAAPAALPGVATVPLAGPVVITPPPPESPRPAAVPESSSAPHLVVAPPATPTAPAPPSAIGSSKIDSPASAYRVGYGEYLRSAGFAQIAALALPGLAGLVVLTGAGGLVGYRQANAGRSVRVQSTTRFMD